MRSNTILSFLLGAATVSALAVPMKRSEDDTTCLGGTGVRAFGVDQHLVLLANQTDAARDDPNVTPLMSLGLYAVSSEEYILQTGLAADDSPGFALDFSGLGTMFPGAGNHSDPVPGPVLTDLKDGSPVGFAYGPSISGWCAVPVDGQDSQYNLILNGSPSLFSLCLNPDSLNYSGVLYWNVTDDTFAQTCTPVQLVLESV